MKTLTEYSTRGNDSVAVILLLLTLDIKKMLLLR